MHGPSTERIDVEASWREWIDDVTKPEPAEVDVKAPRPHIDRRYDEDLIVLRRRGPTGPAPRRHRAEAAKTVHQLGDTRHREIDTACGRPPATASTSTRACYQASTTCRSSVRRARLDVPSTARPPKPVVHDVLPLFRWFTETEPEQPFAVRRTRRSGPPDLPRATVVRVGERRAARRRARVRQRRRQRRIMSANGEPTPSSCSRARPARALCRSSTSRTCRARRPARRTARSARGRCGRSSTSPVIRPSGCSATSRSSTAERGLWFADVALDPGTAFWPFVRLAVTRLQPSSLPALHLSPVVRCDFVPLPPSASPPWPGRTTVTSASS